MNLGVIISDGVLSFGPAPASICRSEFKSAIAANRSCRSIELFDLVRSNHRKFHLSEAASAKKRTKDK